MFLDTVGILILTVPSLMAVGKAIAIDPVHLGVIVVFNVLIGFTTPPFGISLFIVSSVAKRPIEAVARQSLPLIAVAAFVLMIVTFCPKIVLFLPNLLLQ